MRPFLSHPEINPKTGRLLYAWLLSSILSLVFAGIFAVLVALARTPIIQDLLPGKDYFYIALVGHVILAVVIWFLAFEGVLWVFTSTTVLGVEPFSVRLGWISFWFSSIGTIFLVVPALFGWGEPVLANYVPLLTHPIFYTGLLLFAVGVAILIIHTFFIIWKARNEPLPVITFGMVLAGVTVLIAFLCFGLAYYFLAMDSPEGINMEYLFWGGGHILQFSNTIGMVVAWIMLTQLTLRDFPISERITKVLLVIYLLFVIPAPFLYFVYDATYKDGFTRLMQFGLGPSTGIIALAIIAGFRVQGSGFRDIPWADPRFSSLVMSIVIFALGGLISLTIDESNVKIPAHYHGVIGAVTIAFMGMTYYILPVVGREVYSQRLARIQPYLYGLGIILFSLGLFWAGTHGVARKVYGSAQNLDNIQKLLGMGIMGFGGLIAILGGASFVINALVTLLNRVQGVKGSKSRVQV
ncbi:MAG: cbb3-type cytochrome c oxidase subunit I [Deltaproteobacteria bacterium]|nr:cbb3-type cytochrome c oxidase subunit I [Deltaproteobacteria bacterium]